MLSYFVIPKVEHKALGWCTGHPGLALPWDMPLMKMAVEMSVMRVLIMLMVSTVEIV